MAQENANEQDQAVETFGDLDRVPEVETAADSFGLRPIDLTVEAIQERHRRAEQMVTALEDFIKFALRHVQSDRIVMFGDARGEPRPYIPGDVCALMARVCDIRWDFERDRQTGEVRYNITELESGDFTVEVEIFADWFGRPVPAMGSCDTDKPLMRRAFLDALGHLLRIPRNLPGGQSNPTFKEALTNVTSQQIRDAKRALLPLAKKHARENAVHRVITTAFGIRGCSTKELQRYMPHFDPEHARSHVHFAGGGEAAAGPAPKCNKCGKPMNLRTNRTDGSKFWACTGYPQCKNTMPVEAVAPKAPQAPKEEPQKPSKGSKPKTKPPQEPEPEPEASTPQDPEKLL